MADYGDVRLNRRCQLLTAALFIASLILRRFPLPGRGNRGQPTSRRLRPCRANRRRLRRSDLTRWTGCRCHRSPYVSRSAFHAALRSKWHEIKHRLFSQISMNWCGKPPVSHEVMLELMTKAGLRVEFELDRKNYPIGAKWTADRSSDSARISRGASHWGPVARISAKPRKTVK